MKRYKLIVVEEYREYQEGKGATGRIIEEDDFYIGTFPDEEALRRWAEENIGELAKTSPGEEAKK